MREIVNFYDKTLSETAVQIKSTEKLLKQNMEKVEFQKIKETSFRNEDNRSPQAKKI